MAPFNDHTKSEIKERSNGVSELSGKEAGDEGMLVCAHLDHTRNENYNNPENGMRITKFEEAAYHQMHLFEPEKIGMDDLENKSVVMGHMKRFYKKGFPLEGIRQEMGEAIELWEKYLKKESGEPPISIIDDKEYIFDAIDLWKEHVNTPKRKPYTPGGL